ncbi:MAG: precorrin-6Y C5,15-methyltransferase (decarboxylating) subunit CbiT [Selenomonadaceae bacterium]|nr:precorrin-6Y C5,15-methyltransferase (decarboxylating) subunit CbiT [Selenomonadaceae bacterium]
MKTFLGIPDDSFIRGKIPMTKQEIRILTIAKLCLPEDGVIADIGAGTGSISIEAALQMPKGHVFSIERKQEGIDLIKANSAKFEVNNITVIEAEAPDGMAELPELDAAVIGGSGSKLSPILDLLDRKLKHGARLVLNCVTLQTISQASDWLRKAKEEYIYEIIQVQVNRWDQIGPYDMAKALNPIFILTAVKK